LILGNSKFSANEAANAMSKRERGADQVDCSRTCPWWASAWWVWLQGGL